MSITLPTREPLKAVPVSVALEHATLTPVTDNVLGPPVDVKAVSPLLCHVTAPAEDDNIEKSDNNPTTRTANREILRMVYS